MAGKREIKVLILGDSSKAQQAFNKLERAGDGLGTKMGGLGSRLGGLATSFAKVGAAAAAAGAAAATAFGAKAISAASDLNEEISKVGVVFGESASIVTRFADQMAKDFGLPKTQILQAASAIGLVGKASGLAQADAAELGTRMASLAADAASFFNVPLEEALQKIRSGLVGEAEPLRAFGVLLSEDALQAEALARGMGKGAANAGKVKAGIQALAIAQRKAADVTKEFGADSLKAQQATLAVTKAENALAKASAGVKIDLTEQQKVQLRVSIIERQMADATGDLVRTQDSFANRLRELRGRAENFAAAMGTKLLPVVSQAFTIFETKLVPVVQRFASTMQERVGPAVATVRAFIEDRLIPAIQRLVEWFQEKVLPPLSIAAGIFRDKLGGAVERVSDAIERNRDSLQALAEFLTTKVVPILIVVAAILTDVLGRALSLLIDILGRVIGFFREMWKWASRAAEAAGDVAEAIGRLPGSGVVKGAANLLDKIPGFEHGGVVPGPKGAPQLAVVHGGERVIPNGGGGGGGNTYITVPVRTQATGQEIGREVAWAMRGLR